MLNENIEKLIKKINFLINQTNIYFATTGKINHLKNERIEGMVESLEIITGDQYEWTEKGLRKVD